MIKITVLVTKNLCPKPALLSYKNPHLLINKLMKKKQENLQNLAGSSSFCLCNGTENADGVVSLCSSRVTIKFMDVPNSFMHFCVF